MGGLAQNDLDLIPTAVLAASIKRRCEAVFMVLMGEPSAAKVGHRCRVIATGDLNTANDLKRAIEESFDAWLQELVKRGAVLKDEDTGEDVTPE